MRYITNTTETTVTLKDELDYVQKYLYCMKVRYQSSLNYSIHVDEKPSFPTSPQADPSSLLWKMPFAMVELCTAMEHFDHQRGHGRKLAD